MSSSESHFRSIHTPDLPPLLAELGITLALTTYQAGKVIFVSSDGEGLQHLPRTFDTPMGMAVDGNRMALALKDRIVLLSNDSRLASSYPSKPNYYDSLWIPRSVHYCGEPNAHDLAFGEDGLVGVNTLFSCLFRLDEQHSFVPIWEPPFVSALVSEDRCHLNGMALVPGEGERAVASALGTSNECEGWRDNKLEGGVLLSVPEGETVLSGLPMPHSPRWIGGELYLLLSARGELAVVDLDDGSYEVIQRVPGFARGLAFHGDYLFVGMSRLRPGRIFGDVPLAEGDTKCGVAVVHRPSGALMGMVEYTSSCEEVYDVQVLAGMRRPGILGLETSTHLSSLSIPQETFWMAPDADGDDD